MKKFFVMLLSFFVISNVYALDINSKNLVLYNLNDDNVIFEVNKNERVSIASLTKIMTTLVAIENINDINKKVKIPNEAFIGLEESNASVAGFKANEEVTYRDLLYGTFLPSGADAAQSLALSISKNIEDFVGLMNEKAKQLDLNNTNYSNVTGLDDDDNYSTVNDVAKLLKYALKNETFKEIFKSNNYSTSNKRLTFYSTLLQSLKYNKIESSYIIGGKTGFTEKAGRCLASVAYDEDNKIYYLLVTVRADIDNYYNIIDAKNIYEYYFNNYKYHNIVDVGDVLVRLNTKYIKSNKIVIKSNKSISKYMINTFDKTKVEYKYSGTNTIEYGMKKNTKLGSLDIIYDGITLETISILFDATVELSLTNSIKLNIKILTLCIIFIIIIILLFVIMKRFIHFKKYK